MGTSKMLILEPVALGLLSSDGEALDCSLQKVTLRRGHGLVQIPSPSGETTENIQDFIVEVVCAEQI